MATALTVFLAQVKILIGPDDANLELDDSELNALIKEALARYSKDSPDTITGDITGDGGRYYDVATELAAWVEGHSRITAIEYPAVTIASDEAPTYLDDDEWRDDFFDGATRYLFFPNHTPTASETIRVTYSAPYTFSGNPESADTPTQDFYAICNLASCIVCRAIATKYSRTSDSTIAADSARHTSRANEFSRRSAEFCETYADLLGIGDEPDFQPGAGEFLDLDTAPHWPIGRRYLYHSEDTR